MGIQTKTRCCEQLAELRWREDLSSHLRRALLRTLGKESSKAQGGLTHVLKKEGPLPLWQGPLAAGAKRTPSPASTRQRTCTNYTVRKQLAGSKMDKKAQPHHAEPRNPQGSGDPGAQGTIGHRPKNCVQARGLGGTLGWTSCSLSLPTRPSPKR